MNYFSQWKPRTIIGSIILGIGYAFAAINGAADDVSPTGMAITVIGSAALFACTASALCRYLEVWQFIRRTNEQRAHCDQRNQPAPSPPKIRLTREFLTNQRTGGLTF